MVRERREERASVSVCVCVNVSTNGGRSGLEAYGAAGI